MLLTPRAAAPLQLPSNQRSKTMQDHDITFYAATDVLPEGAQVLDNTQDVLALADQLRQQNTLVLQFPKWTDGRAYSQAVLLRSRVHFKGELVAVGEVLADMLPLLRRCGFDAVQLPADQSVAAARRALGFISTPYQRVLAERREAAAQT
jgi:uncharacterized protein (DUF934 family)